MYCKPGVAGSIPGFSIKPLSVVPSVVPVKKYTQIINPPGQYWLLPMEKLQEFLYLKKKKVKSSDTDCMCAHVNMWV